MYTWIRGAFVSGKFHPEERWAECVAVGPQSYAESVQLEISRYGTHEPAEERDTKWELRDMPSVNLRLLGPENDDIHGCHRLKLNV